VDLPNAEERKIFTFPSSVNRYYSLSLDQLAKVADGFSGAEIEQALIAAMYEAFAQDREFTQLDIMLQLSRRCLCREQ